MPHIPRRVPLLNCTDPSVRHGRSRSPRGALALILRLQAQASPDATACRGPHGLCSTSAPEPRRRRCAVGRQCPSGRAYVTAAFRTHRYLSGARMPLADAAYLQFTASFGRPDVSDVHRQGGCHSSAAVVCSLDPPLSLSIRCLGLVAGCLQSRTARHPLWKLATRVLRQCAVPLAW